MRVPLSDTELRSIVCSTLEEATLMVVEPVRPGQVWPDTSSHCAWLECVGPFRLGLQLRASREFVRRSAINIIGLEPDAEVPEVQVADAIRELANIVVGRVIPSIFAQEETIQVGIPVSADGPQVPEGVTCSRVKMVAEDTHPIELTLWARPSV